MATSSSIFSMQVSTPPRSDSRAVGAARSLEGWEFAVDDNFVLLLLPPSALREDRTFRLPEGVGSGSSVVPDGGGGIEEGVSAFSGGVGTSS